MSGDRLHALAVEMLGEGATVEVSEKADVLTAIATAGDGKAKAARSVSVPSGPGAEDEGRAKLFGALLREHHDRAREQDWHAKLDDAYERGHGRHAPAGPREPKKNEPPQYEAATPRAPGPRTPGRGAPVGLDAAELQLQRARIREAAEQ